MLELNYTDANGEIQTTTVNAETATNVILVDPTTIKTDRIKNNRAEIKNIKELAESIDSSGQLSPVIAVVDGDGELSLVAGFRRHAAIMYLREHHPARANMEILVQIVDAVEASAKAIMNITENVQRENLSGMEKARAVVALLEEHKMNRSEVAKIFGASVAWVSNIKSLVNLPEEFQKAIEEGKIPEQAGYEISKMTPEKQAEWLEVLKENGGITYQQVHEARRKPKSTGGNEDAEDESAEESAEPAAIRPRPGKTIAAFFDLMGQADNDKPLSEDGQKFVKTLSKFAAGKIGEKPVIKALRELFPA